MNIDLSEKVINALKKAKEKPLDSDYVDLLIYLVESEKEKESNKKDEYTVDVHNMSVAQVASAMYKSVYTIKRFALSGKLVFKCREKYNRYVFDIDLMNEEQQEMIKKFYLIH